MITEKQAREADNNTHATDLLECGRFPRTLLLWANQELARREAERAERAKPIDVEWLESIGFKVPKPTGFFSADTLDEDVSVFFDNGILDTVQINWSSLWHITTRGQLLDLLKALKDGES